MSIDPKLVDVAAKVLRAAMEQGNREPYSLAFVLESAQLLQSPELAAELATLRARVAELEYVAPSPSCARCYGADAVRFVAQGGATAPCPVCDPSGVEQLQAQVTELKAERHSTNEALSDAAEQLRVQRDRIAELETVLKKYVGVEPTVAEELAYVSRCLHAVYAVCDAAEKQASRWENPLPVPEWVALIRNAADGVTVNAPALPPVPQQRQTEDPHDGPNHHDYALGRDLPFIPQQVTGRCPQGHTFEDCTCGGTPR